MSGHIPCKCGNRDNWRVIQRNCNYSYFEKPKGEKHYSEYSLVKCFTIGCNGVFRTKAKYINGLPDGEHRLLPGYRR